MSTIIIIIGLIGTLLLGFAAYKKLSESGVAIKKAPPPTKRRREFPSYLKFRIKWKWRWRWFWLAALAAYLVIAYHFYPWPPVDNYSGVAGKPKTSQPGVRLPADVALPVIAGCESGNGTSGSGRQFNTDGTVVKNPKSSAIGKYQIMSSLHEDKAKGLGFDIRTEKGNEAYARYLYAESGTQHWEADPISRICWEPKLIALGHGTSGSCETSIFFVEAKPGQPAKVDMIPGCMIVWWGDTALFTSRAYFTEKKVKIREFTLRGHKSAWIKIHRYYDPDPLWYVRTDSTYR